MSFGRRALTRAISEAMIAKLNQLQFGPGDATSAMRLVRALVHVAANVAEAADMPPAVFIVQLQRVLAQRLPRLKPGKPVLVQKPGQA